MSLALLTTTDPLLTSQSASPTAPGIINRTISSGSSSLVSTSASAGSSSRLSTATTNEVTPITQNHAAPLDTTSKTTLAAILSSWISGTQSSLSPLSTSFSHSASLVATTSSLSIPNSTLVSQPTSQQHGTYVAIVTTSLVVISSYEVPSTSQSFTSRSSRSTTPTLTSEPEPSLTAAPETPGRYDHRLIIDLGDCAGFASPRLNLVAGEMSDPVPVGDGRFEIELKSDPASLVFGLGVSLKDDGVRCGSKYSASCMLIDIGFGATSELVVNVLKSGDYGIDMYPFSIWLEDGVTWDGRSVNSPNKTYQCWGWTDAECPYAFSANGAGGATWTLSSKNLTGDVYIDFCPSDGPAWASIPPNPSPDAQNWGQQSTYVVLPTRTTVSTSTFVKPIGPTSPSSPNLTDSLPCDEPSACAVLSTYIIKEGTTTLPSSFIIPMPDTTRHEGTRIIIEATTAVLETTLLATGGLPTIHPSTAIILDSTITSRKTTFFATPTPTPSATLPIVTTSSMSSVIQSGWPSSSTEPRTRRPIGIPSTESSALVSTPAPTVIPTYSYISDSLGPTVSTSSYDIITSPAPTTTPTSDTQYILTSWSTWMTVNGSTVPAIAGEVGVLTTVSITYLLESGSIIPLSELSTRTVAPGQTSTPSSTPAASVDDNQSGQTQGGRIAGAVVGTLVGLVLGSLLLWYICYRRQRRQMRDSFARGGPSWLAPGHQVGSGGGSGLLVDLDQEPRMSNSYVEPWVPPRPVAHSSRKGGQSEMGSTPGAYGVSTIAGPSREPESSSSEGGSSWSHGSSEQHQVPIPATTRAGKSNTRNEPTRRPNVMISQRPVSSSYLSPSLASPSLSLLPTPFRDEPPSPLMPASPLTQVAPLLNPRGRVRMSHRERLNDEEQARQNAIPPLYNEAWNTVR